MLSILGAVRLARDEAMTIIMMKRRSISLLSLQWGKFVYVDDILIPVDRDNMEYASAFELFLEFGNDHCSKVFDKLME
eukprot:5575820-Heterocapsa_arctica.AAC.1